MKRTPLRRSKPLSADPEKVREFLRKSRAPDRPPVERVCRTCGTKFVISAGAAARGEGKFCSRDCWPRTVYVERLCANCGRPFRVQERFTRKSKRGRFCSRACANGPRSTTDGKRRKYVGSRSGQSRFRSGQDRCVHPDCNDPAHPAQHEHHVVYEQHVRSEGGDVFDPRNALRLCVSCHSSHHRRGRRVVPLAALRDENYEFAFELLGRAAEIYLRRRYAGEDPRLALWVRRAEATAASSGDR